MGRQCVKEDPPLVDGTVSQLFVSPSYHKTSRLWTVEPVAYRRQATAQVDVRGAG